MRDHYDERVAEAMEQELRRRVRPTGRLRNHERRRVALVTVVVAVLLAGITIAALRLAPQSREPAGGCEDGPAACSSTPTPRITVSGAALPYAGVVPWSGAIVGTAGADSVLIAADGDDVRKQAFFVCGLPEERVRVQETTTTVIITIDAYAKPLPAGESCAGVGHAAQPITVQLRTPLGDRRLIDAATGGAHRVIASTSVPVPATLPAGFAPASFLGSALSWDERSGTAERTWSTTSTRKGDFDALILSVPVTRAVDAPSGTETTGFALGGRAVRVWRYEDELNWVAEFRWTLADGRAVGLRYRADPARHVSLAELEAVVRSVPDR